MGHAVHHFKVRINIKILADKFKTLYRYKMEAIDVNHLSFRGTSPWFFIWLAVRNTMFNNVFAFDKVSIGDK